MSDCRECGNELIAGKTWWPSYAEQNDRTCIKCKKAYDQKRRAEAKITEAKCQGAICGRCGNELIVGTNWYASRARQNNRICIECELDYSRKWREENPSYRRQYYVEHREEENERNCQYYAKHQEEISESHRQYAAEHREEAVERMRRWRKENPGKAREKCRRRYARLAGTTVEEVDEAVIYKHCGNRYIYCGSKENLSLDHITPINTGGPHCEDNLVVACRRCNSSKGAKPLMEWLQTQPYSQAWVM